MDAPRKDPRLAALRRFALTITIFNLLGHTVFGFEQSWAQPIAALATTYTMELLLELADARAGRRPPRFLGGPGALIDFLLPAHIAGLAVAMLLYAGPRLAPIVFAAAVAIGSKAIFRIPAGRGTRHFLNPSNFGISLTLVLFPTVGIAPPYHFSENLPIVGQWLLPAFIIASGTLLNAKLARRMPVVLAWVGGFAALALLRSVIIGAPIVAALLPMTGVAFILYSFYMITDPGTTPVAPRDQALFGLAVAATYAILMLLHIVFGLFFALTIVCALRGLRLYALDRLTRWTRAAAPTPEPALAGR